MPKKKKNKRPYITAHCELCKADKTIGELVRCYHVHTQELPQHRVTLNKQGRSLILAAQ